MACAEVPPLILGGLQTSHPGRTPEQTVSDDVLRAYGAQHGLLDTLVPKTLIPRAIKGLQAG